MQRTNTAGRARQVVLALAIVVGVAAAVSGCIPSQPNLKNAYLVNTERISRGLRPFGWDDELAAKARNWAQQMADSNTVKHSDLTAGITRGWGVLGENVGAGTSIDQVHDAFMQVARAPQGHPQRRLRHHGHRRLRAQRPVLGRRGLQGVAPQTDQLLISLRRSITLSMIP